VGSLRHRIAVPVLLLVIVAGFFSFVLATANMPLIYERVLFYDVFLSHWTLAAESKNGTTVQLAFDGTYSFDNTTLTIPQTVTPDYLAVLDERYPYANFHPDVSVEHDEYWQVTAESLSRKLFGFGYYDNYYLMIIEDSVTTTITI